MKRRYMLIILCCTFLLPFATEAACNICGSYTYDSSICSNCRLRLSRGGRDIVRGIRGVDCIEFPKPSNVDIPSRRTVQGVSDINIPKKVKKGLGKILAGLIALIGGAFSWIFERKKKK